MVGLMRSVFDRCQDVLSLQVRIVLEDLIERGPRPEEFQDVRYANPHSANARTPPTLAFVNGDSLEPFCGHIASLCAEAHPGVPIPAYIVCEKVSLVSPAVDEAARKGE